MAAPGHNGLPEVPGYVVERELGHGGMAVVYGATDLKHGRPVAIKVVKPECAALLGTERFLREIQITAQLAHPHISRSSTRVARTACSTTSCPWSEVSRFGPGCDARRVCR